MLFDLGPWVGVIKISLKQNRGDNAGSDDATITNSITDTDTTTNINNTRDDTADTETPTDDENIPTSNDTTPEDQSVEAQDVNDILLCTAQHKHIPLQGLSSKALYFLPIFIAHNDLYFFHIHVCTVHTRHHQLKAALTPGLGATFLRHLSKSRSPLPKLRATNHKIL